MRHPFLNFVAPANAGAPDRSSLDAGFRRPDGIAGILLLLLLAAGAAHAASKSAAPAAAPPVTEKEPARREMQSRVVRGDLILYIPVRGTVEADGAFIASYGVPLKPGRYSLRVTLVTGDKTSLASTPVDVPDFDAPGLKRGSLLLYPEGEPPADAQDPYSAFAVGALRLRPRLGNVFTPADALHAVCVLYGGQADPATGKASLRARLSFTRDGRPVAAGQPETFDTASAVVSAGPVPLADFAPGRYLAKVEAMDLVSGKSETREAAFEIQP